LSITINGGGDLRNPVAMVNEIAVFGFDSITISDVPYASFRSLFPGTDMPIALLSGGSVTISNSTIDFSADPSSPNFGGPGGGAGGQGNLSGGAPRW
jgi:hypothetical protein